MKLLTFRFSPTLGGFDESALQDFVRSREILDFREHFFTVSDVPYLACVLTYQDAVVPPGIMEDARAATTAGPPPWARKSAKIPANLDEQGRALYIALREWRRDTSRNEGRPPFLILTNAQLLDIALSRPASPTALGQVKRVGPATVKRYGEAVLRIVGAAAARESAAAAKAAAGAPLAAPEAAGGEACAEAEDAKATETCDAPATEEARA